MRAQQPPLPCAPPVDRPLRLSYTQHFWRPDGRAAQVMAERRIVFHPQDAGWLVEAHLTRLVPDASDPAAAARLRAAYGPTNAPPLHIRLDPLGRITDVEDADMLWDAFVARQAALWTAGDSERKRAADARLAALTHADRIGVIVGFLRPVLHWCGTRPPAEAGTTPDGLIAIPVLESRPGAQQTGRALIDPATGLARTVDQRLTLAEAPLRPMVEQWTLAPE